MNKYKHYSFDLWLTLIKSNPLFKIKRAEYFYEHFNPHKKPLAEVENIIRSIDNMCNISNEQIGGSINALTMYMWVADQLDYDIKYLSLRDYQSIYHIMETLFFQYPPVLYSEHTAKKLSQLKYGGATLSILSNTGFIEGITLKKLMVLLKLDAYFSFQMYSDEYGISKPSTHLFLTMVNNVFRIREFNPVAMSEVIHIGDNPTADVMGGQNIGIDAMLINSNDKTILDVL